MTESDSPQRNSAMKGLPATLCLVVAAALVFTGWLIAHDSSGVLFATSDLGKVSVGRLVSSLS